MGAIARMAAPGRPKVHQHGCQLSARPDQIRIRHFHNPVARIFLQLRRSPSDTDRESVG